MPIVERELTRNRHPVDRRNPTLYPSSASVRLEDGRVVGGCWRSDWYRIHSVPKSDPDTLYIKLTQLLGQAIEDAIIEGMKRAGIYENDQVYLFMPDVNLSGKLDVVGRYRTSEGELRYYGNEAKSVHGMGAQQHIKGRARAWRGQPAFNPKPKDSALMQTMIYLDQFAADKGDDFVLDWFQLMYVPRDNTGVYREYTVTLVTTDTLPLDLRIEFLDKMVPGQKYALVETRDFPSYVDTRFSMQDIYDRFAEEFELIRNGSIPDRTFKKFYSNEEIEYLYSIGEIGKTAYEKWVKKGRQPSSLENTPGHFLCKRYCNYRSFCYLRNGQPNPEADLVGIEERN